MWRRHALVVLAVLAVGAVGCGGSDDADSSTSTQKKKEGPADIVRAFLAAVKEGEDEKSLLPMITSTARNVMTEVDVPLSPSGSDTAEFAVGKVKYVGQDGAQVACTLSDLDDKGVRQSQNILWMVRREREGWRIAGVATVVNGKPDKGLDFEDRRQMTALHAQINGNTPVAKQPKSPDTSIRR